MLKISILSLNTPKWVLARILHFWTKICRQEKFRQLSHSPKFRAGRNYPPPCHDAAGKKYPSLAAIAAALEHNAHRPSFQPDLTCAISLIVTRGTEALVLDEIWFYRNGKLTLYVFDRSF